MTVPRPQIKIDAGRCTGCGECVEICGHVLTLREGVAWMHPDRFCNDCGHCVAICPEGALSLESHLTPVPAGELPAPEQLEQLFARRRSVRRYRPDPVPQEVLQRLVRAAALAPSGCNSRSPHYTFVTDRERIEEIGRLFQRLSRPFTWLWGHDWTQALLQRIPLNAARMASNSKMVNAMNALREIGDERNWITLGAPVLVLFHADPGNSTPLEDCTIAATQLVLLAESLGLGTCFNGILTGLLNTWPPLRQQWEIPSTHHLYLTLCLGYPDVSFARGLERPPASVRFIPAK